MEFQEGPKPLSSLAELAVLEINAAKQAGRNIKDQEVIDELAGVIHDRWRQDNASAGIPESRNKLYGELDNTEKEQYRIVVREAGGAVEALDKPKLAA